MSGRHRALTSMSSLEAILRRDRTIIGAALAVIASLAWIYLFAIERLMGADMDMRGMDMPGMKMFAPGFAAWSTADAAFMVAMWVVMMVGMMTPSAAPMILLYARVGRQAIERGQPFAATGWFAGGYLAAWAGFGLLATAAQWVLEQAALLNPMMTSASDSFGGAVLIAAGLYQWTPWKDACLRQCQGPLQFIMRHGGFRPEPQRALALGIRHGLYCVGCCWALMALLFVVGVMNLGWIAAIAVVVLLEKAVPAGRWLSRIGGVGFIGSGIWLLS